MTPALACLIAVFLAGAWLCQALYFYGVSPLGDGIRYLLLAGKKRMPAPFHYRWLLPKLLGARPFRWQIVSYVSVLLTGPAIVWYSLAMGLSLKEALVAVVLWMGLWGAFREHVFDPVSPGGVSILLTTLSSAAFVSGHPILGVLLSLISATCRETAPLFIAIASWSPLALLGLLAPVCRHLYQKPLSPREDPAGEVALLVNPFSEVRARRQRIPGSAWEDYIAPWGVVLLSSFHPTPAVVLTTVLGYSQLLLAIDGARLYQFGFLPLVVVVAPLIPPDFLVPLLLVHLSNPWARK